MNLTKNTELRLDRAGFRNRRDRILLWDTVFGLVVTLNLVAEFFQMSSVSASASRFADVLVSQTHSSQITPSAASAYDWLIGDWAADVYDYENGEKRVSKGEWHFSWVLEGRAIQDVWIVPKREDRNERTPANHNRYGTTIRIFDPKIGAWRVFWFNPVTQDRAELIERLEMPSFSKVSTMNLSVAGSSMILSRIRSSGAERLRTTAERPGN
jgi:hypothetical protein